MTTNTIVSSVRRSPLRVALALTLSTALVAALALVLAGRAEADHLPVHGITMARAPFADSTAIQLRGLVGGKMHVGNARDIGETIVQEITIQPGGFTGWHTHPGPVVVMVEEGTFTVYQGGDADCTPFAYGPNESFIDPGQGNVHSARNNGSVPMVAWAIYFDVPVDVMSPFIPAANPGHCDGF
ncbi:MAG TPA: cupin domain-containing protein [Candidatus Binatia bacterium]|nr:cupin domain-containing protein [Candidatus Binatia bacterium]